MRLPRTRPSTGIRLGAIANGLPEADKGWSGAGNALLAQSALRQAKTLGQGGRGDQGVEEGGANCRGDGHGGS